MEAHVDLTNLRSMTDGDAEMEKILFEEFFSSFEAGLTGLQNSCSADLQETWRQHAHALKGIALNLGAEPLGKLSKQAQDNYLAASEAKREMLGPIRAEYEQVKEFLMKIIVN